MLTVGEELAKRKTQKEMVAKEKAEAAERKVKKVKSNRKNLEVSS